MTPDDVKEIVGRELAAWQAPRVAPGTTIGSAWPAARYQDHIERLRAALVVPYQQTFELRETDDPDQRRVSGQATYWVVAQTPEMVLWYDPTTREFGVAEPSSEGLFPVSIGLRGDLVGSFAAW